MSQLGVAYKPGDVVSASFNFAKDRHEDLSFKRDEELRIINIAKDPNWAHAKNSKGETGLIPLNYVKLSCIFSEDLTCYQWFHGRISRAESEKILTGHPPGSFMVRNSDLFTGDLTLCVVGPPSALDLDLDTMNGGSSNSHMVSGVEDLPPTNVQHYHIICKQRNGLAYATTSNYSQGTMNYSLDEYDWFTNLPDLIKFYSVPNSGLVAPLKYPVPDLLRERLKRLRESGWIISRKDLVLGDQIGRGEFGEVLRATYHNTEVAVKICKKTACKLAITYEAALMTNLRHPNLLAFVGLVYEPEDNAIYLVTEYLAQGNLLTYLNSRTRDEVTEKDKLQFSVDVCRGLAYLEERGIIHRDIAARNILLSGRYPRIIAKVADFGMARDLTHATQYPMAYDAAGTMTPIGTYNNNQCAVSDLSSSTDVQSSFASDVDSLYTMHTLSLHDNAAIPIKWSAPEAVRKREFTIKSDVWSFGILLWEIYSYGRIPYPRMLASQVLPQLRAGYRMKAPEDCPPEIYRLMRQTWNLDPEDRPSFATILAELTSYLAAYSSNSTISVERIVSVRAVPAGRTPVSLNSSGAYVVSLAPRTEDGDDPWSSRLERRRCMSNGHGSFRAADTNEFVEPYRGYTTPGSSRQYLTLTRKDSKRMSRSFTLTNADTDSRSTDIRRSTRYLANGGGHSVTVHHSR